MFFFSNSILQAIDVLIQYLILDRSEKKFLEWLHSCGITNSEQKRDCFKCIKKWYLSIRYDFKKIYVEIDKNRTKIEFVSAKFFLVYLCLRA